MKATDRSTRTPLRWRFTLVATGGLFGLLAFVACNGSSGQQAVVTDSPRYTPEQVANAILQYRRDNPDARIRACAPDDAAYVGDGLWDCSGTTFDERTGQMFRERYAAPTP